MDHPRSRGVYDWERPIVGDAPGSSPLARGLLMPVVISIEQDRIIPARAGFTVDVLPPLRPHADHPRSRGVYALIPFQTVWIPGSSPLARGLHAHEPLPRWLGRIIPARAGFTVQEARDRHERSDHPRSRGVY